MILVLWVLNSPGLVSCRVQCRMPNVQALFQVIKSLTLLTKHKKIVTFPLWGGISVGGGHAVNQPQAKERKMYSLVICSLDRVCKGWGMDVQTKISKWIESLNLSNIHLIAISFFVSACHFYQSFLIVILINSTAFNIAWQVKNFVFYLQPCHLNDNKHPSFWFLENSCHISSAFQLLHPCLWICDVPGLLGVCEKNS